MITEQMPTKYQVVIGGVPYGAPQATQQQASMLLMNLTQDQRVLAEVRVVNQTGQQMLLG